VSGPSVLVTYPLQVPTYFNAGHHLALYQVAGYLRERAGARVRSVDVVDGATGSVTWRDLAAQLARGNYAVVAVQNDLEGVDGTERLLAYIRTLSPGTKTVSFGRMTATTPEVMRRFDFDALVESGDFEPGVAAAVDIFTLGGPASQTAGVSFRTPAGWQPQSALGHRLSATEWYLPDPDELPLDRYADLYASDSRRFSGLPFLREFVVPVARGCPIGCSFCEVPIAFGRHEIRMSVERTVDYIDRAARAADIDYVSFYAPTFTLNRSWVVELCRRLASRPGELRWKCCTTLHHLDKDLVARMARSGCFRISVGLETLTPPGLGTLPKIKERGATRFHEVARWCRDSGVELNCFVIVGLPGDSPADAEWTIQEVKRVGARVRPTFYCDWHSMVPDESETSLALHNRHLPTGDGAERAEFVRALFHAVAD
jgi:anaerobic magnesium-protoporphyrin IX monomethyl ester cyclase